MHLVPERLSVHGAWTYTAQVGAPGRQGEAFCYIPHGARVFACTSTGTGPMAVTLGGGCLATPRGKTSSPPGVRMNDMRRDESKGLWLVVDGNMRCECVDVAPWEEKLLW